MEVKSAESKTNYACSADVLEKVRNVIGVHFAWGLGDRVTSVFPKGGNVKRGLMPASINVIVSVAIVGNGGTFEKPANRFEAFKERWIPKFLLRHFPVKYAKMKLRDDAVYPLLSFEKEVREVELC